MQVSLDRAMQVLMRRVADILVVDDDAELATTVSDILQCERHRVRIAHDGREWLAALDERCPDLVILDAEMPQLDGPGMAYEMLIRNAGKELVPVLLVSGVIDLRAIADRVGTPYWIGKPTSLDQLLQLTAQALREKVPPHPLRHDVVRP